MEHTIFPVIDLEATGKRIKQVREQRGITVRQLQMFLGFNEPVAIYKWQRGECLPTFDNMYAMACLFEVSIDELLVGNRQEFSFCVHLLRNIWKFVILSAYGIMMHKTDRIWFVECI